MDFDELEPMEGLRWSWNSWPRKRSDVEALVIPLSVMFTPLSQFKELPILPYDPLVCIECSAVLNPYAKVEYRTGLWNCSFCNGKNRFPKSHIGVDESSVPAELFPTYNTVEYNVAKKALNLVPNSGSKSGPGHENGSILKVGSSKSVLGGENGLIPKGGPASGSDWNSPGFAPGPAFVLVVDACTGEEELRGLKRELLNVITMLPGNALVGLVVFDSLVTVYDLGFSEAMRVVIFDGRREISAEKTKELLGICQIKQHFARTSAVKKQGFLMPVSECEFSVTYAIENLVFPSNTVPGDRPLRSTGVAISVAVGLLEGCLLNSASRIIVFTSGPATIGPGLIVDSDYSNAIRTHQEIDSGISPYFQGSSKFYQRLSRRMLESSIVLDLFACSLDQVGAAELKVLVEESGGLMMLAESFASEQFRKCLDYIFICDEEGNLKLCFDATIQLLTTKGVKICGALGPCVSLQKKNGSVSNKGIGEGDTYMWKLGTLTDKTCIAFFFEVDDRQDVEPGSAFLLQFITQYRYGNMGIRKRVTTVARRWVGNNLPEIASGFDQEAAAAVMARLAIHQTKKTVAREVTRWLDEKLIRFAAQFGGYVPEDPSSFRLSSNFSLYPQFMYHLRRSQFIDVFNSTPDETAFLRLMLNREGVVGSLLMIQPALLRYSFEGPPTAVLLDVRSISPDVILLFDSFFHVVIHYGSNIAQWTKLGYYKNPGHENLRKLLEAVELHAEQLVSDRFPVPKLVRCNQHSSQARLLLVKLNPSVTQDSASADDSEVIFTDEASLETFLEHLLALAVQG